MTEHSYEELKKLSREELLKILLDNIKKSENEVPNIQWIK
jgi:hypothetical protein